MYRLSRLNRMLTLHANKPSTTRMEDTDESNTTDDGTSTNDVALNGTVNEDETANDTLVTDTDTASSTDDDDQPTYRSKLRLTTLPASRRNTKTPSKSLYRQLPSIQQKQKHPLPSIQQKQQTEKQKTNQGVLPLTNSTRNKISTTSSSSTSSYEQRKRQLAENQQQRPNPTATTGQQQQKSKQKEPQSTSQQQQPQNTNKTNTTKPTTTNEQLITQRLNEEFSIDSFLRGDYDRPFDNKQAPAPHPGLTPGDTVNIALRALRALNVPEVDHGAAVFRTFCAELSRNDRWGGGVANTRGLKGGGCEGSSSSSSSIRRGNGSDSSIGEEGTPKNSGISLWKEILRGALTPTMFARRIRASDEFSILLDWERLDVTDGMAVNPAYYAGREWDEGQRQLLGIGSTVAFVNAAMFFGEGIEPSIVQFTLVRMSGVWLIDTAVVSKKEWFMDDGDGDDGYEEEEEQEQEFDDGDA